MIKLIAVDIDGTMTFRDRRLDIPAIEAIRKAEDSGVPVTVATGNALCFAEAVAILVGTSGPTIAEDGGVIFDRSNNRHVLGSAEEADRGLEVLRKEFDIEETWSSRIRLAGRTLKRTITAEQAMEVFQREGLNLTAVDSSYAVHIKPTNVNKGAAIGEVASLLGISTEEIAAIGDAANDVEMLKVTGMGFATANSHESVKKAADRVTESPHGKGVREAIDEILKLNR